jgi:hypothetical protein
MQSGVNAIKRTGDYLVPYMAPYLMNHNLRKYLIKGELGCSGRVGSSTSGTRRVNLITNPVINHEWGKDREVFTTSGTYGSVVIIQEFYFD